MIQDVTAEVLRLYDDNPSISVACCYLLLLMFI